MHALQLGGSPTPPSRVLVVGCHADDIEIGCGATILQLSRSLPTLHVTWVVLAASGERAEEARQSAEAFLSAVTSKEIVIHDFRDGFLPYHGAELKEVFEALKPSTPDIVFTHARHDLHQDHRLACELTWNTFRDHLVFEYEIPKYDGDIGTPNVFIPVSAELAREKVALVTAAFPSQQSKHWFDEELLLALMRIRGMEARSESGYAEAFVGRKLNLVAAMRVLVTGHHGYIGSVLTEIVAAAGHDVVGFDTYFYRGCDLGDPRLWTPARDYDVRDVSVDDLAGFDAIVHLAALSNDPLGDLDRDWTFRINLEGLCILPGRPGRPVCGASFSRRPVRCTEPRVATICSMRPRRCGH